MSAKRKEIVDRVNSAFAANNVEGFLSCCADEVTWTMVGEKTVKGKDAIRTWIEQATIGNKAIATPTAVQKNGDRHTIAVTVAGAFTGSPITLTFRFRLQGEHIAELEIGCDPLLLRQAHA